MASVVCENIDDNEAEELLERLSELQSKCKIETAKQIQARIESGAAKSEREASRQIAGEIGESEETVKKRAYRGKKALGTVVPNDTTAENDSEKSGCSGCNIEPEKLPNEIERRAEKTGSKRKAIKEIAEQTGAKEETVKSQYQRQKAKQEEAQNEPKSRADEIDEMLAQDPLNFATAELKRLHKELKKEIGRIKRGCFEDMPQWALLRVLKNLKIYAAKL